MSITPKNWNEFQHYKNRAPIWIKLHRTLLDNYDFARLPIASRALAPMLWLLASEYENGEITASVDEIAFRLRWTEKELSEALKPLIAGGFFIDASDVLAGRKQDACLEKEIETEKEKEKIEARTRAPQPKGSRLPPDWLPSEGGIAYASTHGLDGSQDLREEIEKFRNFWHARAGREASKLDWDATWRNWVLNWKKFNGNSRQANGRPKPPKPTNYRELAESIIQGSHAVGASPPDAGLLPASGGNVAVLLPPRRSG